MISGTLTLFNWTLRMDSKTVYPHIIRAAFSCFMLFSISIAFFEAFGTSRVGLRFFESICFMNVMLITVSGISYFVTAVTEEKDAGTFALLRLAGMTSLSITLGKSTSRLVSSLMLLVVQLPFTFLSITLGGILWQQIAAAYVALAAWMILIANLALFCSVRCATSGRAAGLAGVIIVLFFTLPTIVTEALAAAPPGVLSKGATDFLASVPDVISAISVQDRLTSLLKTNAPVVFFGTQFWASILIAFVLFSVSTLTLDFWSAPAEVGGPSKNPGIRRWSVGRSWRLAVAWKEFLFFTGGRSFVIAKLIGGGLILAAFVLLQQLNNSSAGLMLEGEDGWHAFLTFVALLSIEVLLYASGCLFSEVRQGTQGILATLPVSSARILLEKAIGCLVGLIPVVFWILVTLFLGFDSVVRHCSSTMVVSYLIVLGYSSHVGVLLSLYTRWAALPLTILFSTPAFFCLAAPILSLTAVTTALARSHNLEMTLFLSALVNLFWTWLFILLPLQIWIRDRWNSVTQQ